ncbi:hypothetical protein [Methylotetracoccus oryzae]|uniref:hypothetical protein n=1 Tax=Methylotetracoccus oryzae TaxID=1919059 RepID=UPI00111B9151|nr:hypothetical protein [Methylotetracoccus oryzae]
MDWLQTVANLHLPSVISHDHLLRAMDALLDQGTAVEDLIAAQLRLKSNGSAASPKTALQLLSRIQQHRATVGSKTLFRHLSNHPRTTRTLRRTASARPEIAGCSHIF